MTSWHAGGIPAEYFHKHKGHRRAERDHLIEILQRCSEDREQHRGQGQRVIKQEGAGFRRGNFSSSVTICL